MDGIQYNAEMGMVARLRMTVANSSENRYKIGRIVFRLVNCDEELQSVASALFPRPPEDANDDPTVEIDARDEADFRQLLNKVLKLHDDCYWFDAACVTSPNGRKFFLAGQSGAGKSTTSLALALGFGWRVASEDLVLIDPKRKLVLSLFSPFSLKAGTKQRLEEAIGCAPDTLIKGEYAPIAQNAAAPEIALPFDYAIFLRNTGEPIKVEPTTAMNFVRWTLPFSNLLRTADGIDIFLELLGGTRCYDLHGGSVKDRLDAIIKLAE